MFRIRKISNPFLQVNHQAMQKIKDIIRKQFPDLKEEKIDEVELQLKDPLTYKYQTILLVAEDVNESIRGFALLLHMSDLAFCYLDFIAVTPGKTSSGVGGALYERVREEAMAYEASGLFFECLPDDPALYRNPQYIPQNAKRLAFYERYGARPIINTKYETPVNPDDDGAPYLVFDDLGSKKPLSGKALKKVFGAVLERKYAEYCPTEYVQMVVDSVTDDPVKIRDYKYRKNNHIEPVGKQERKIFWAINDKHNIHHIRERGYVESPVRISSIQKELEKTGMFINGMVNEYPDKFILQVHDKGYFDYFKRVCKRLKPGKSVYPYVFPIRNNTRPPRELSVRAGYYCIDTFTPLNQNAYLAARWGVNCALTAADKILGGVRAAYVLTRPPGHHAERLTFGGFCYFNNNAIVANYLSNFGKVAILDIDYHHGNGQQQIFYNRNDVFTVSIHGDPSFAYPYFTGFKDEVGEEEGAGFNLNFPVAETVSAEQYRAVLAKAIKAIITYKPDFLVLALGLDTAKGDPTGTWSLSAKDFELNGALIAALKLPTVIVQEGGYKNQSLGTNARAFFKGFYHNHY